MDHSTYAKNWDFKNGHRKIARRFGFGAALIFGLWLSACQAQDEPKPAHSAQVERVDPMARWHKVAKECEATGGQTSTGAFGQPVCIHQTGDAGKSCTSSNQCEGVCLAEGGGQCAAQRPRFGCYKVMENGQTPTLCVD